MNALFVSVIIPCRNEENFIRKCLDSVMAQDYPKDKLEVLVVDGMSEDKTREIVEDYSLRHPYIKLLSNPKRIPAAAFNTGVSSASGELIMLMSAHSAYTKDYISSCVRFLNEHQADNVGGILKIMPGENTTIGKAIAFALAHRFGSGNAYVKTGSKEPRWADTAAFGCYKKDVIQKIGLFNEHLAGSSDLDMNARLRAAGGKILLVPEIVINYYADRNLRAFIRHNFSDGVWATYVLKFGSKAWSWRHWIPLIFVLSAIGSAVLSVALPGFLWLFYGIIGMYALASLGASLQVALRERKLSYLAALPIVFLVRHLAHGVGA